MKTYKQRTGDILEKARQKQRNKKRTLTAAISSCACAAVVALACVLFIPLPQPPTAADAYKNSEYYPVIQQLDKKLNTVKGPVYKNNFEKLTTTIEDFFNIFAGCGGMSGDKGNMMAPAEPDFDGAVNEGLAGDKQDSAEADSSGYVETTDNQTQGVIEADLFKRTESHIFYLFGNTVYAYKIAGLDTKLVGSYQITVRENTFHRGGGEFYLSMDGKTATLIRSVTLLNEEQKIKNVYTEIVSLDVSDPTNITEKGRNYLSGDYVSSRMADGKLLVINNFYVYRGVDFSEESSFLPQYGDLENMQSVAADDIICPKELTTTNYSVICQIDEGSGIAEDCMALLSYSSTIYASAENLFITRNFREKEEGVTQTKTEFSCISYKDEGLKYVHSATVAGSVLNQYSMDEYEGIFRIVTTTDKGSTSASLYCIDMQSFETVGKVENFAPLGEQVFSVRFDGDKAYVCTALVITMTDPVYAFDLSDVANITYVETGEIKGYSSSLVQFKDGFLLGIGYGSSRDTLKIEIYQETEKSVEGITMYELKAEFSENYKSYFIDRERGLVGLGIDQYSYEKGGMVNEYILLEFDGYRLNEVLRTELGGAASLKRATLIDEYLYMFGIKKLDDGSFVADFKVEKVN